MRQGEIWYADLNPTKGSEQSGFRPVVIVSGDLLNTHLKTVIICPLTTKVKEYKGNPVLEPNKQNKLSEKSEVLVFHIRSVSKDRLVRKIGTVSKREVNQIQTTVQDILRY
ncbi:MAG: type II toxin-antitoxin system PemK/MazF family toxin [Ekhidna sp.]|uniref:type II toxin-antitoxin system PemK/MazF family toxin n=1 Tax=Ekhidna sp. TaxID=2608089 RepID=UPI0032EE5AB7